MVEVHTDEGIAGLAKIRTVELFSLPVRHRAPD
jgi:hypothetical protein